MRYKRLIAIALCIIVFGVCMPMAYANDNMVVSAYMLEGNLYYCNSNTGQVVLKNVKPLMKEAADLAKKIEYTETRLFGKNLFMSDGTQIEYDWLNNYADDVVRVIAIEQANGNISILYLRFV